MRLPKTPWAVQVGAPVDVRFRRFDHRTQCPFCGFGSIYFRVFRFIFFIPSKQCVGGFGMTVEWAFDNVKNGKRGRSPFFATDLPGGLLGFRLHLFLPARANCLTGGFALFPWSI